MNNKRIMVSVIVLTYNHQKYIRQALDSIVMQKVNFCYEIIVGDDCSLDTTQNILKEYKNRYPDIFQLTLRDKNIGATKNLYDLLLKAKGKYLASLEGDDYWTDANKLQTQVDFLEAHNEYIGCTHKCIIVDENGKMDCRKKIDWVCDKEVFTLHDYKGIKLPGQSATFVKRNIFLDPKYDYSIIFKAHPMIADRTMGLIFSAQGDIYRMDRVMSHYRQVINKKGTNATSVLYIRNDSKVYDDFKMTCDLEKYARDTLQKKVDFSQRKKELFVDALFSLVKGSTKKNFNVLKMIISEGKAPIQYIIFLPKGIFLKVMKKIIIN